MLNRLERLTQRVGGSNELVDQWLQARKQLLVAYCTLVGLKPNNKEGRVRQGGVNSEPAFRLGNVCVMR